jgi:YD repeat-containing protein
MKQILALIVLVCVLCGCSAGAPGTGPSETLPPGTVAGTRILYEPLKTVTVNSDGSVVKTLYTYDGGHLMEQLRYYNDILQNTETVVCDSYGRPIRKTGIQNEKETLTELTYDAQGNLLSSTFSVEEEVQLTEEFSYDAVGNPLVHIQTNTLLGTVLRTEYRYRDGKLEAEEAYTNDSLYSRAEYAYGADGALSSVTNYGPEGQLLGRQTYATDAEKRITTATQYDAAGTVIGTTVTTRDENGCVIRTEMTYGTATMTSEYSYIAIEVDPDTPRRA